MREKSMDLTVEKIFGQILQGDEVMQYLQVKRTTFFSKEIQQKHNSMIQTHLRMITILIFIHIHPFHIKNTKNSKQTNSKNKMNLPSALMKYNDTAKSSRSAVHRRMSSPKSALNKCN